MCLARAAPRNAGSPGAPTLAGGAAPAPWVSPCAEPVLRSGVGIAAEPRHRRTRRIARDSNRHHYLSQDFVDTGSASQGSLASKGRAACIWVRIAQPVDWYPPVIDRLGADDFERLASSELRSGLQECVQADPMTEVSQERSAGSRISTPKLVVGREPPRRRVWVSRSGGRTRTLTARGAPADRNTQGRLEWLNLATNPD